MKVIIRAAGRIKSGPERDLIDDYLKRANGACRSVGMTGISETELDVRNAKTRADETAQILGQPDPTQISIIMDERGKALSSRQIAKAIARWRDDGVSTLAFHIGAADGFEPDALPPGHVKWSMGAATWPHKLARVMLTEQLYRAVSILAGSPYHRD